MNRAVMPRLAFEQHPREGQLEAPRSAAFTKPELAGIGTSTFRQRIVDMARGIIAKHLRLAEKHVADGERHVAQQRQLVEQLNRDGHDTANSWKVLKLFEELLDMHVADRERLRGELRKLDSLA